MTDNHDMKQKLLAATLHQKALDQEHKRKNSIKSYYKKKRKAYQPSNKNLKLYRPSIWIDKGHTYKIDTIGHDKEGNLIFKETKILSNVDGKDELTVVKEDPVPKAIIVPTPEDKEKKLAEKIRKDREVAFENEIKKARKLLDDYESKKGKEEQRSASSLLPS